MSLRFCEKNVSGEEVFYVEMQYKAGITHCCGGEAATGAKARRRTLIEMLYSSSA